MALTRSGWGAAMAFAVITGTGAAHGQPDDGCTAATEGCYRDGDGNFRDARAEYARRLDALDPDHLRALVEETSVLAIGTFWYWLDRSRNLADWDFPSWKQRFSGEAWRFDNNHFPINFAAHPLNGGAFYVIPRLNDHGLAVSATYAFMTSFAWEFLIEFREKVSVNDLIVTQGAGMPIGEFANKLFRYVNGIPEDASLGKKILAWTLGFPYWAHRAVDGDPTYADGPYDDHGYASAIGSHLFAGYRVNLHDYGERSLVTHGFRLGGRLSTIPGEGRPGSFAQFFHEADIVSLTLDAGFGRDAREVELYTDNHLLGLYAQDLDQSGDGDAFALGLNLAYRYRFQDLDTYNDRLGILHLPGIGTDYHHHSGPLTLSTHWRLNGDFAGLHAPAYGEWADANVRDGDRPKSILRKHGYAYAWGVSSRFGASIALPPIDLRVDGWLGAYDSQEGLDRTQDELTLDPDSDDRLMEVQAELGFRVPGTPVRLGAGWSSRKRWHRVDSNATLRSLRTWR
ncbi:MAG: DUF3943 domain-containing protein, partial [Polyangiaceae bacterium]